MGHLKNVLSTYKRTELISSRFFDKENSRTQMAAEVLLKKHSSFGDISHEDLDLEYISEQCQRALDKDSWRAFKLKEFRSVPFILFDASFEFENKHQLLVSYVKEVAKRKTKLYINPIIYSYLLFYDPQSDYIKIAGEFLSSIVKKWNWQWSELDKRFNLFSPSEGHANIANSILSSDENPIEFLLSIGISENFQYSGLSEAVFAACLERLDDSEESQIESLTYKILNWAIPKDQLYYQKYKSKLIESVLLPWKDANPGSDLKDFIQNKLISTFKDPRISQSAWLDVCDDAKRVLRKWLSRRSLEQFIQLINELARDDHWKFRKAFWTAYYDAGVVEDAWVVLTNSGHELARRKRILNDDPTWDNHARFSTAPARADHSVLIMKIGNLTIADFSHDGKCRIWDLNHPNTPDLYQKYYSKEEMMARCDFSQTHHPQYDPQLYRTRQSSWQAKVAKQIAQRTGVELDFNEFIPD